jgi:methionyl-tRNA formyltransferase
VSIVFAGTPENAATSLRLLVESGVPISLVLTRPDAPIGRKSVLTPSPVAVVAEELRLPVIKSNKIDDQIIGELKAQRISFAIVIAFGVILRDDALASLEKGWFNVHYGLLPKWRGAAPVQQAIIAGDTETGVTIFKIDQGLDTGPILGSVNTRIEPVETSGDLLKRLTLLGVSLLLEVLPQIDSGVFNLKQQPSIGISLAPKLARSDAKLDFHRDAKSLSNLVRGANPEPGAWCTTSLGYELKIHRASFTDESQPAIGECLLRDGRLFVGCGSGSLELVEVQPAGKQRMDAIAWYRGLNQKIEIGVIV